MVLINGPMGQGPRASSREAVLFKGGGLWGAEFSRLTNGKNVI